MAARTYNSPMYLLSINVSLFLIKYTLRPVETRDPESNPSMAPLHLHVWPSRWSLPSIDAPCIESILFLQLTCPGRFSVIETTDPDTSPTGQLPFLVHSQVTVTSLPSIISYIAALDHELLEVENEFTLPGLNTNLDAGLSAKDASKRMAWRAYLEGKLGDLVVCPTSPL